MSIRINANVSEARQAAGHSIEQWGRFYHFTKEEATQLSQTHKDWSRWILIPANEKERMLERINTQLEADGIRPVEMIILKWRVSQLLRDIQRKFSEGDMVRATSVANPASSSPQRSKTSPSGTRPFDPIRDV